MDTAKVIRKSYKFRIYPNKSQTAKLEMTLDLCRELYNAALQERRDAWRLNKINISCFDQINQIPAIKKTNPEYNEILSRVLDGVLRQVDKTFKEFYKRIEKGEKAGFPRFKSENRFNGFSTNRNGFWLKDNKFEFSKIGKMKIKLSQAVVGKIKVCTIFRQLNKWYVSFTVETKTQPLPKTGKSVGVDVGIESFITFSDGVKVTNHRFFESSQRKLRIAQRSIDRKKKKSKSRQKAVHRLRKFHLKIYNRRLDFQLKISTFLIKEFDLIAIEKLNIKGLAKSYLSKQINDVAWYKFFEMLKYKAESADKLVIEVNPNYTSQDCSACGDRVKKELNIRIHKCSNCGLTIHRDENAALNILKIALGQSDLDLTYANGQSVSNESVN